MVIDVHDENLCCEYLADFMHQFAQCFMCNCIFRIVIEIGIIIMALHMKRVSPTSLFPSQ